MKKIFKPAYIGFYLLMLLVFFILGLCYAEMIEAGKGQGLAGGAIVLGYGAMFGGIAFLASFFIASRLQVKTVVKINWVLLVVLFATCGYKYYEFRQRDRIKEAPKKEVQPKPTTPTLDASINALAYANKLDNHRGSEASSFRYFTLRTGKLWGCCSRLSLVGGFVNRTIE